MDKITSKTEPDKNEKNELVLTPGGWRPKSKVHLVELGHHISVEDGNLKIIHTETGKLIKDFGKIQEVPEEKGKRILRVRLAERKKGAAATTPITDGWIIYSDWTSNTENPISYFRTRWIVPREPATNNDQTVYLFNGLQETIEGPFILQPVLQWGASPAGGGKFWSITNWYVDREGGHAFHGHLVRVNPGDVLDGVMSLLGQYGKSFSYISSFTGFPTTDLRAYSKELRWACETLECYGFKAFTDYPDAEFTAFRDIEIRVRTATKPNIIDTNATINWQANNIVTDNGQQCRILSNASPGGEVRLYYRKVT
jgi:hypothetical protein